MYLDRTPQIGDKIHVTEPAVRLMRQKARLLNNGIVTSVDTSYGHTPLVFFSHGAEDGAVNSKYCKVIDPEAFEFSPPADWENSTITDPFYHGA